MTQQGQEPSAPHARPPTATPRATEPAGQMGRRPALSWVAAFGALVVAVMLVRTLVAYPLLPARLAGPAAPTDTPYSNEGAGQGDQGGPPQVNSTTLTIGVVSMSSAESGWAFGHSTYDASPVLLRYSSGSWRQRRAPLPPRPTTTSMPSDGSLSSILAVSDDKAWATAGNMVLHFADGTWQTDLASSDPNIFLTVGKHICTLHAHRREHDRWRPSRTSWLPCSSNSCPQSRSAC